MKREEAFKEALDYFHDDELAANVFLDKYALTDGDNYLESTPNAMHLRMAKELARVDVKYASNWGYIPSNEECETYSSHYYKSQVVTYYKLMKNFRYVIPQGSPMSGLGNNYNIQSLSNCFVIPPVEDSYGGILKSDEEIAQICKRRGGVGVDLSKLRPADTKVHNSAKTSTGVVSFMERFSNTTKEVAQCIAKDMDVLTTSGLKHIQDVKAGEKVWTNVGYVEVEEVIESGVKEIIKTTSSSGFSILTSKDHIFLNKDKEEVRIKDNFGNPLCLLKGSREIPTKPEANINMIGYYILGLVFNNSHYIDEDIIKLTFPKSEKDYIVFKVKSMLDSLFSKSYKVEEDNDTIKIIIDIFNTDTLAFLSPLVQLIPREISRFIKKSSFSNQLYFIEGLLDNLYNQSTELNRTKGHFSELKFFKKLLNTYGIDSVVHFSSGLEIIINESFYESLKKYTLQPLIRYNIEQALKDDSFTLDSLDQLYTEQVSTFPEQVNMKTYDLVLKEEHLFWCEGFYVHNSGRRGATMLSIDVEHPDVEKFIESKLDLEKINGANISVKYSDAFMNALIKGQKYTQSFESNTVDIKHSVPARKVWEKAINANWISAEPGCLFWDTIINTCPSSVYPRLKPSTVNPCGELPLPPYDSCRLIVVNAYSYVKDAFIKGYFDWKSFKEHVQLAQAMLDNLIDLEIEKIDLIIDKIQNDPEDESIKSTELNIWKNIRETTLFGRRTGLGLTGIGDAIAALDYRYGDDDSINFVNELYKQLALNSYTASIALAAARGTFPAYDYKTEKNHPFIKKIYNSLSSDMQSLYKSYGRRNVANLTTSPTGSVSLMAQVSSGIEPVFSLEYERRKKTKGIDKEEWTTHTVYHKGFQDWKDITNLTNVEDSPYYKATANEIPWLESVKIQAAASEWMDHAISKTVNLPSDIKSEEISNIYIEAWKRGCKGITIYRDGSRDGILSTIKKEENKTNTSFEYRDAIKRPNFLDCDIHFSKIKGKNWVILVGLLDSKPYEIFGGVIHLTEKLKSINHPRILKRRFKHIQNKYDLYDGNDLVLSDIIGSLDNIDYAVMTRMLSLSLRHGARPSFLSEQLKKEIIGSFDSFNKVLSRVLKKYITDGTIVSSEKQLESCEHPGKCNLVYQEGCVVCTTCGLSKCG